MVDICNSMKIREPVVDNVVIEEWTPPKRRERGLDTMPEQQRAAIDAEWNRWLDVRVADALDRFSEEYSKHVIDIVFTRIHKAEDAAKAEIKQLRDEVGQLRAELTLLREIAKGNVREFGRRMDGPVPHLSS
jgi:hypothetical protein